VQFGELLALATPARSPRRVSAAANRHVAQDCRDTKRCQRRREREMPANAVRALRAISLMY
jgi:hypothetical protein